MVDSAVPERDVQSVSLLIVDEFGLLGLRIEDENALRAHSALQTFSPIGWGLAHDDSQAAIPNAATTMASQRIPRR
jgi:hypothetical protein